MGIRAENDRRVAAVAAFVGYVAVIVGANWMISHVGTAVPGAHLLPVGFGLMAPSGVYLAAAAFVFRDMLQRLAGPKVGLVAIVVGAAISAFVSSAHLAVASGATFLLSETCDFLIYTPIQKRNFPLAVLTSGIVADIVDSTVFLTLAGIPFADALPGQLVGKLWVMLIGGVIAAWIRRYPLFSVARTNMRGAIS